MTPNMYAIHEFSPRKVLVLFTSHVGSVRACKTIEKLSEEMKIVLETRGVADAYSPESTRNCILSYLKQYPSGERSGIEIFATSGTKPMSIGAYLAGLDLELPVSYFETEFRYLYSPRGTDVHSFPNSYKPRCEDIVRWQNPEYHVQPNNEGCRSGAKIAIEKNDANKGKLSWFTGRWLEEYVFYHFASIPGAENPMGISEILEQELKKQRPFI